MSFQPVSKYTRQLMEQQNTFDYKKEVPTKQAPTVGQPFKPIGMSLKDTLSQHTFEPSENNFNDDIAS